MKLLFRPSVALYYEFVQGRTLPYSAYLICGPEAHGVALGAYDLTVDVPSKTVICDPELASDDYYLATYDFDCLSFFSFSDARIQVAQADIRLVKKGEVYSLNTLISPLITSYEEDLQKVIEA